MENTQHNSKIFKGMEPEIRQVVEAVLRDPVVNATVRGRTQHLLGKRSEIYVDTRLETKMLQGTNLIAQMSFDQGLEYLVNKGVISQTTPKLYDINPRYLQMFRDVKQQINEVASASSGQSL